MLDEQIRAHFEYYQIKPHVLTARAAHDLNIHFRSFDNDCNEYYVRITFFIHTHTFVAFMQ